MGSLLYRPQVSPNEVAPKPSFFSQSADISRASFKFIRKVASSGVQEESTWWLAANEANSQETFFIKQISKVKVYNHKRVEAVLEEMRLMTSSTNSNMIKVYFAFQDYEFLYLVTESLDSISFEQLLEEHSFSEDETRYVVTALLGILDYVHSRGYALTELSPKNIHFDQKSGQLKLMEMGSPTRIDEFCRSNAVSAICPYSAPEILFRGKVLAECDFFSIGVIMYEMMTQQRVFQTIQLERNTLLKENLEVEKSKIPEEWEPEAADFLIKILVKNPALRLGRFGSFQVKNHAWLKQFDREDHYKNRLYLDNFQCLVRDEISREKVKELEAPVSAQLKKDYFFQEEFEEYSFRMEEGQEARLSCNEDSYFGKDSILFNSSNIRLG